VRAGRAADARPLLERALQLADLDPASAERALSQLRAHEPDWAARRVVRVTVFADEALRARESWRVQMRLAWTALSQTLEPVLGVRFVPVRIDAFSSEDAGLDLVPLRAAFQRQRPRVPADGVIALFTGRPVPKAPGTWQRGVADFLGRVIVVRLAPGEVTSRVLTHEVLHLYGCVHVNPEVRSLMNPDGEGTALDAWNVAIARALRGRSFGPGGLEANVLPHLDLDATIAAYRKALVANVSLRNAGVVTALDAAGGSWLSAAGEVQTAMALDDHLGDVASFLAQLLARDGRRPASAAMWETAARLYGPASERGRNARQRGRALAAPVP
jgi:hypothetical protein